MAAALIFVLWYAAIAAKLAAAYRLIKDRLVGRFPTVWIYLLFCSARSIILISLKGDPARYQQVYSYTTPLGLLLEAFAVVGVFWTVAEQAPRFRWPGSVILGCLAGIGTSAAWLTHFIAVPPDWAAPWQVARVLERNCVLIMTIVLAGTRFFLRRLPGIAIRPSASRMADILTANAAADFVASAFVTATALKYRGTAQILTVGGNFVCMAAIAVFVTKAADKTADIRPVTDRDEEAMIEAERWLERLVEAPSHQAR